MTVDNNPVKTGFKLLFLGAPSIHYGIKGAAPSERNFVGAIVKHFVNLRLALHRSRLLARLIIIRHRHVADDRAFVAGIASLPAQLLDDVVRVFVVARRLAGPRHAVEIGSLGSFVESCFVDLRHVDFDFDRSWHIWFWLDFFCNG